MELEERKKVKSCLRDESYVPGENHSHDRVVLEILGQILSAVYKYEFSSGVFLSTTSTAHDALLEAKTRLGECRHCLKVSVSLSDGRFKELLWAVLRRRIDDDRFIRLINKFLKTREYGRYGPLGGLFTDLCLMGLDDLLKKQTFVRYGTDVLIFSDDTDLDLTAGFEVETKTYVPTQKIRFLGYDLVKKERVLLLFPQDVFLHIVKKLNLVENLNEKPWKVKAQTGYINLPDHEIVRLFNHKLGTVYLYYALADNVSQKLDQLKHLVEYSLLKTLAQKHKTTVSKYKWNHREPKGEGAWCIKEGKNVFRLQRSFRKRKRPVRNFDYNRFLEDWMESRMR